MLPLFPRLLEHISCVGSLLSLVFLTLEHM
nr:MAG TPA: hypothetical protein [Caudoviricetes sp.]DAZ03478.1 MAG TPA: hypothetical protein [Caudoviricetes sp.]